MKTAMMAMSLMMWFASESVALEPKTLAEVCDNLPGARDTVECFKAARGLPLDALAAGACDRLSRSRDTIECVAAISGREYQEGEVRACDRLSRPADTVDCLSAAGRPGYGSGSSPELRRVVLECRARNRYSAEILRCIELRAGVASQEGPSRFPNLGSR